jgi:type II secretory pathway pseudopilin PulG
MTRNSRKSNAGFTIVELVIATAMVSGIVLLAFQFQKNVKTQLVNIGEQTDVIFDQAGAIRAISDDVSFSDPSFNYVNNSLGSQESDFFTITENDTSERVLELKSVSSSSCIKFFSVDKTKTLNSVTGVIFRKNTLLVSPSYFYNPRVIMTAPLVYVSTKLPSLLTTNNLLVPGQYIKVAGMSPVLTSGGGMNFYRDYSMLFKVNSSNGLDIQTSAASPVPFYSNPTGNAVSGKCTNNNSSFDMFLRCLPTPGGGATNFYVIPVVPITYCLKAHGAGERGYQLYRKKGSTDLLIASGVEYLKLTRKKSSSPIIDIDLKFCSVTMASGICKK